MGMFDTFYGEVTCPHCGKTHEFEEQTKSYECVLSSFLIGDYIDKANTNYIYNFDWICDETNKPFKIGIVIRRGQIVKFLIDNEIENTDINTLENIEDGLGKRLQYEKTCKEADGYPKEKLTFELNPLPEGYIFTAFGVKWEVIKLYLQRKQFFSDDIEYFYEIKSKEHGLRILECSSRIWFTGMAIVTFEHANKYRSLYFDDEE